MVLGSEVFPSSVSHSSRLLSLRRVPWKPPIHSWLVEVQKALDLRLASGVASSLMRLSP